MKTMTRRQLGSPCHLGRQGETVDAAIKAQDLHRKTVVKSGDVSHQEARDAMKGRWRQPKQSLT
jgi:hypothetical protein